MDAETIADFFDTVLDSTWTRKYDLGWNGQDTRPRAGKSAQQPE